MKTNLEDILFGKDPEDIRDLKELYSRLAEGVYFDDFDEDLRLLGVLRKFIERL